MTILDRPNHDLPGNGSAAGPRFGRTIRWIVILAAIAATLGVGFWLRQYGLGGTIAGLPIVESIEEQTTTTNTSAVPAVGAAGVALPVVALSAPEVETMAAETEQTPVTDAAEADSEPNTDATTNALHIVTIAGTNGAALRNANGDLLQTISTGTPLSATARSADGLWLFIVAGELQGWVERTQVFGFGFSQLPVKDNAPDMTPMVEESPAVEEALEAISATAAAISSDEATEEAAAGGLEQTGVLATVTLDSARLNVRRGPSTESVIIAKAYPDETYAVLARDETRAWLQIALTDGDGDFGWVSAEFVMPSAPVDSLPVSTAESSAPAYSSSASAGSAENVVPAAAATSAASSAAALSGTLVFQASHGTIYVYDLENGAVWYLTDGFDPAISPDGATVAFTRDGGEHGLYLIDVDGSNERLIFSGRTALSAPKWSADGAWILFARGDEYDECYPVGPGVCLSPKEFAARFPDGAPFDVTLVREIEYNLAAVDSNGDNYHDLATLESARAADWNEAGIVYQSSSGLQVTADTADAQNELVAFDYLNPYYYDPDWQPDGGQIAFMVRGASHWEIYVINPDGSGMTALTKPVTALVDELPSNVAPAYSPDGRYIVYLSNRGEDNSAGAWQLWVMEADGSNAYPLSVGVDIEYTFGDEQAVSWGW